MSFSSPTSLPRPIVSHRLQLDGRWHLAGSTIAVGEVRLDHAAWGRDSSYRYPGVSADELASCLAFDFPAVRESSVAMLAGTTVVSCACGEDTTAAGGLDEPIQCVCGRVWRLRLLLTLIQDGMAVRDSAAAVLVTAAP